MNLHKRLSIQYLVIAHNSPNSTFFKTFLSDLEGKFTRKRDFTWRVSDCEELVGVTAFGTFNAVFEISFHNYGNEIPV